MSLEPQQEVVPTQLVTLRPKDRVRMRLHVRDAPPRIAAM
jgi:hypothetical protein